MSKAASHFFWKAGLFCLIAYGIGILKGPQIHQFMTEAKKLREDMAAAVPNAKPRLNIPENKVAPKLEESEQTYKVNGKEYVLIENKYYEYRSDHIYEVNGQRVFYINKRAHTQAKPGEVLAEDPARDVAAARGDVQGLIDSVDDTVLSPTEALKKLQDLQSQMKDRDSFLNNMRADGQ